MRFEIDYKPTPKARPRVTKWGAYTPKKTKDALEAYQWQVKSSDNCPTEPLTCPLSAEIVFYVPIPKSWWKKKTEAMHGQPVAKGNFDLDNLEKTVYDALEGIVFKNDGQIWKHTVEKVWTNDEPKIVVDLFKEESNPY